MTDHAVTQLRREWIYEHRGMGHDPHPAPTPENPERWECACEPGGMVAVWRLLSPSQIQAKFAHLRNEGIYG